MSNILTKPRIRDPNGVFHRQRRIFPWRTAGTSEPIVPPDVPTGDNFNYWLEGLPFTDPSNNDAFLYWIDGLTF